LTDKISYRNWISKPGEFNSIIWRIVFVLNILIVVCCLPATAQEESDFEEISVFLYSRQVGTIEMPAYIYGQELYLPVTSIFSFLKIYNRPTPGFDTISGFFINQETPFLIDRVNNMISYHDEVFKLREGDLIRTENNLYLKSRYFGEIFGLECNFVFNSMSVTLTTKIELPVIREMKQEMMRSNLNRLKGDMRPDTIIERNYPVFHFGAADWSLSTTERVNGRFDARLNLALGGILFGGEAAINLNYSKGQPFDSRQQSYRWHFANNDFKIVKQIAIGRVPVQSAISLNAPVNGILISNTPTTFQRSFCTYTLSDQTEPGWIVELYVNYVLVDYVKADASGYFSFEVPLVYGNSLVKLRFYGPWGEEHIREQTIRIPFNFLPPGRFEYTINAGMADNDQNSIYSKVNLSYGLNRRLTMGTGVEYLSTDRITPVMPFVNFSLRLATSLLFSGEYTLGVRFRGMMSYRLPADLLLELYYSKLAANQTAVSSNYLEERKMVVSLPLRLRLFSSLLRLTMHQIVLPGSKYLSSEFLISGAMFGVSTNLTTYALFLNPTNPYIYSTLSLGIKLPARIIFTPQIQYVYSHARFLSAKVEFEKRIFRNGTVNILIERNFENRFNTFQLGIRYDFSDLQVNTSVRNSNNQTSFTQFVRGSMVYEAKGGPPQFSRNSAVGMGGLIVAPFLDVNNNGKYELGEKRINGLNIRIGGGRIEKNFKDSTIRVTELEPFTNYYIEMDRVGFENVSWQIPNPIVSVSINPNQSRRIEIPIKVVGEVSGVVFFQNDTLRKGIGRIVVSVYSDKNKFVMKIMSEDDGYFNYLGLAPGNYYAKIDENQLRSISMACYPDVIPFSIKPSQDGDQVDGLEFNVREIPKSQEGEHSK
jgi:hypothetical protein